ncbi:histidine kinase, partial [Streptomyces sp. G1]|nr:histidine kinase [Streptomyces sp. G1]
AEGAVVMAAEHAAGTAAAGNGLGGTVPPQGVPASGGGRRARRGAGEQPALAPALPAVASGPVPAQAGAEENPQPTGRRRRALAAANERAAAQEAGPRTVFALPPADADRGEQPAQGQPGQAMPGAPVPPAQAQPAAPVPPAQAQPAQMQPAQAQVPAQVPAPPAEVPLAEVPAPEVPVADEGRHDAVPHDQAEDHTPPQPHPTSAPTGRRRRVMPPTAQPGQPAQPEPQPQPQSQPVEDQAQQIPAQQAPQQLPVAQAQPQAQAQTQAPAPGPAPQPPAPVAAPLPAEAPPAMATPAQGVPAAQGTPAPGTPLPPEAEQPRAAQPLPAEAAAPVDPNSTQGRAISVRTLGQGVPFTRQAAQVQQPTPTPPPHQTNGGGRRRKLGTRQEPEPTPVPPEQSARPHPQPEPPKPQAQPQPQPSLAGQSRPAQATEGTGRSYAIGAPDENAAEGPEPLDGPGGAVEVADPPRPQPMDDELPPEPLDNPRRLLVWPAPDVTTQQALSDRGYRPVIVNSREEVDAQIAAFPAALFVDPLTGPITRTALQSLRQAAVAAEVPVMVTAGLGQASREAAYGADPAVLLKALAPRDSEQHPPRVLLIEEHAEIALALTATLERRGMQVARAASDTDAVTLAGQFRPNLVVMDLLQVHRRQAGIVDWLRANGQLNRTPLVVYTAAVDQADLPRLASGETVLFLAERSTSPEVQTRIVDLLARIGTN